MKNRKLEALESSGYLRWWVQAGLMNMATDKSSL